ncbi:MAG: hypothetical protein ACI4W0_03680 [Bacilli bacterium]
MKNESGFIATSLIYTFFLAFIAILTALLSNYIANKTILDRYNSDTQSKLNGGIGKISLYVSYASVDGGKTITNLVRNGNFSSVDGSNNLTDWSVQGGGNFQAADFGKRCVIKTGSSGNLSQPISVDSTHKYYIRMEYYQPSIGYTSDVFVSNTVSGDVIDRDRIISSSNSSEWVSTSKLVSLSGAETLSYMIVGKQSTYNTNRTYYTNIFLMDVTYAYRDAVSLEWLDKNIDYFDGTVSFISKDFVDDDEVSFTVVPYAGYVLDKVSCNYDDYEVSPITNESNTKYLFKYRNNGRDSKCSISFKHN